ncbi:DDE-type integrase/transposase/recombinase [Commensalibacter intestini]
MLLTSKRNIKAAQRFFRKAFKENSLLAPTHIGTDKALPFLKIIQTMKNEHVFPNHCFHETKKIHTTKYRKQSDIEDKTKVSPDRKNIQEGLDRDELQSNNVSIINKVIEMQHIALLSN